MIKISQIKEKFKNLFNKTNSIEQKLDLLRVREALINTDKQIEKLNSKKPTAENTRKLAAAQDYKTLLLEKEKLYLWQEANQEPVNKFLTLIRDTLLEKSEMVMTLNMVNSGKEVFIYSCNVSLGYLLLTLEDAGYKFNVEAGPTAELRKLTVKL